MKMVNKYLGMRTYLSYLRIIVRSRFSDIRHGYDFVPSRILKKRSFSVVSARNDWKRNYYRDKISVYLSDPDSGILKSFPLSLAQWLARELAPYDVSGSNSGKGENE